VVTVYCYDSEFLEDGKTIELISIGIVSETGREYYAVSSELPEKRIRKNQWLMDNVVPSLPKPAGDWNNHMPKRWLFDYHNPVVKRRDRIATEVKAFLLAEDEPELWGDYVAYDHVVLAQLFGRMIDLPDGIPMYTNELQQELRRAPEGFVPPEQTNGLHNALEDARHNMRVFRALREAGQGV
jgi:hypothetical protein